VARVQRQHRGVRGGAAGGGAGLDLGAGDPKVGGVGDAVRIQGEGCEDLYRDPLGVQEDAGAAGACCCWCCCCCGGAHDFGVRGGGGADGFSTAVRVRLLRLLGIADDAAADVSCSGCPDSIAGECYSVCQSVQLLQCCT